MIDTAEDESSKAKKDEAEHLLSSANYGVALPRTSRSCGSIRTVSQLLRCQEAVKGRGN